jgi:signal transduction histidine kinase
MRVDRAPVALGSLVEDVIASFEGQIRDRPIALASDVPARLAPLMTDPAKLLQVLMNLIGNAVKFTERGTVMVRVVADPASRRPERIEVADTGIGIPAERQQAIFDAFEQADSSTARRFGGTGLGLAVSKSLCDVMGYGLEVRSEAGMGSTFTVILTPAGQADRAERPHLVEGAPAEV